MSNSWLSATKAIESLKLKSNLNITHSNLKKLCISQACNAYINCDGADGTEQGTSRKVLATGNQRINNPEKIQRQTLSYVDRPSQEILIIGNEILLSGWVLDLETTHTENKNASECQWSIHASKNTYAVVFKSSEIDALAKTPALLDGLLEQSEYISKSANYPEDERQMDTKVIAELKEALAAEREARQELEKKLVLETDTPKTAHLLTIAGLLELLVMDGNRPHYDQGIVATAIDAKGWWGASESTVTKLFAAANAAAIEAEKKTKAKAEARDAIAKKRPVS